MALTFLVLAAVFPATWHAWAIRRSSNANHLFAVALLFGVWQARPHAPLQTLAHEVRAIVRQCASGGLRSHVI